MTILDLELDWAWTKDKELGLVNFATSVNMTWEMTQSGENIGVSVTPSKFYYYMALSPNKDSETN